MLQNSHTIPSNSSKRFHRRRREVGSALCKHCQAGEIVTLNVLYGYGRTAFHKLNTVSGAMYSAGGSFVVLTP